MFNLKRSIMAFVFFAVLVTFYAFNSYISGIGYAPEEDWEKFKRSLPICHGYSMTLSDDTPADGDKVDLCLGWLERK